MEEEYAASRAKLNQSMCTVHAKLQAENNKSEIQSLRAEIKEVKSVFAALATHPSQVSEERPENCQLTPRLVWNLR